MKTQFPNFTQNTENSVDARFPRRRQAVQNLLGTPQTQKKEVLRSESASGRVNLKHIKTRNLCTNLKHFGTTCGQTSFSDRNKNVLFLSYCSASAPCAKNFSGSVLLVTPRCPAESQELGNKF